MMNLHLCFAPSAIPSCLCNYGLQQSASPNSQFSFSDTLTPEVQSAIQKLLSVAPQIQFLDRVVDVPVVIVMCCTC